MPLSFWSVAHAPNPNLDSAGADLARHSETFARGVELGWAFRARALFCAFRGLLPFAFAPSRGRSQRWRARARGWRQPSGRHGARERGRRRGRGRESEPTSPCASCSPVRARERECAWVRAGACQCARPHARVVVGKGVRCPPALATAAQVRAPRTLPQTHTRHRRRPSSPDGSAGSLALTVGGDGTGPVEGLHAEAAAPLPAQLPPPSSGGAWRHRRRALRRGRG